MSSRTLAGVDPDEAPDDAALEAMTERFLEAWRTGRTPRVEEFLAAAPPESRETAERILILFEAGARRDRGEELSLAEYAGRFPAIDPAILARLVEVPFSGKAPPGAGLEGTRVGRDGEYRLLDVIGRGGMGVVYRAQQESPVRRLVAVKLLNRNLDSPAARARFDVDRDALALMEHPNIVKVFDGGTTDAGVPYFVMEHLACESITSYCDRRQLGVRARLELFLVVCDAVEHAHRRGVIHRDLKPANIAVVEVDGTAAVKVIDFGIAKVLNAPPPGAAVTRVEDVVGTYTHMPPEQVQPSRLGIDTRADVYSLGVTLYELLTCTLPLSEEVLSTATAPERTRIIATLDPDRPSARILATGGDAGARERRPLDSARLARAVRGELDAIVMKALEKDRDDRYGSASELSDDLRRFLRDEPVLAAPPGLARRMRKAAARHPAASGVAVASALLVVVAAALLWWHAEDVAEKNVELEDARSREEARRVDAERSAAAAEKARGEEREQRGRAQRLAGEILEKKRERDRLYYAARIGETASALRRGQTDLAARMLDTLRPEPGDGGLAELRGWEWRHLHHLCHGGRRVLAGHAGRVLAVAFCPDGRTLATGSADCTARIWDVRTGRTLHGLEGHLHSVTCAAFSDDGSVLATGSEDATVRLWHTATGAEFATLTGHVLAVTAVTFVPGGKLLASGSKDGTVQIFDVASRERVRVLEAHGGGVAAVAIDPDGGRLATAGGEGERGAGSVRVWDLATGALLRRYRANSSYVFFTDAGRRLVFGGINCLRAVELATGSTVYTVGATPTPPAGGVLADTQSAGAAGGRSTSSMTGRTLGFRHAALSPDGARICTALDGAFQVLDAATGAELASPGGVNAASDLVAWSSDGTEVATVADDHSVQIWSASKDVGWTTLRGQRVRVRTVAFSPDGRRVAASGDDPAIRIWEPGSDREPLVLGRHAYEYGPTEETGGRPLRSISTHEGHGTGVTQVAFDPSGRWLASSGQDHSVRVWDAATGREALVLDVPSNATSVAWSPDGALLAAGAWDDRIHLFEFPSGRRLREFAGHTENVAAVAFLGSGRELVSAGRDRTLRRWDVGTGAPVGEPLSLGEVGDPTRLAVSADGSSVAVAGHGMTVGIWDTTTWAQVRMLWGHAGWVADVAFSADGTRIVSAGGKRDDAVRIWDVASGAEVMRLPGMLAARFGGDDRSLAVGIWPHEVRVYDASPRSDLERRRAPPAAELQAARDDGAVHALGWFTARRLKGTFGLPPVLNAPVSRVYLAALVSIPAGRLIPTPERFDAMNARSRAAGEEESPTREAVALYDPRRLELLLGDAEPVKGELVCTWPEGPSTGVVRSLHAESTDRIDPHERRGAVVVWSVDARVPGPPMRIRLDGDDAVAVPDVRLAPSAELVPTRPDLAARVRRAVELVAKGASVAAVAEAQAAADDPEADIATLYDCGCVHALAIPLLEKEEGLAETERRVRTATWGAAAVSLLRRAVLAGYFDLDHVLADTDFDSVRARPDFQEVLLLLDDAPGPARK